jgi:hypothetical protein
LKVSLLSEGFKTQHLPNILDASLVTSGMTNAWRMHDGDVQSLSTGYMIGKKMNPAKQFRRYVIVYFHFRLNFVVRINYKKALFGAKANK